MDTAHDIADATDWLKTPLSALSSLENALHCQICKEFFDTPMITSCSHTFCSKCIRIALSTDGCCPACRTQDQASKLRNNWSLQEVVANFLVARPATLDLARQEQHATESATKRPGKRKRVLEETDHVDAESTGRTTRSKSRKTLSSQQSQPESIDLVDAAEDDAYTPEAQSVNDGLVECLLGCGQRMKIEDIEPHLDRCEDERKARELAAARAKKPPAARPQDRLNELNYSMMKERDLAKKMRDLGIPAAGTKQLLIRRHTAWVNIWNANCDSSSPRTKRELLKELNTWERTQGGGAPHNTSSIMKKDFDGNSWSKDNQDDFSRLIANARRTKAKAAVHKEEQEEKEDTMNGITVHSGSPDATQSDEAIVEPLQVDVDGSSASNEPASTQPLQHNALLAQSHFGHEDLNEVLEPNDVAQAAHDQKDKKPDDLISRLGSGQVKKMPMFEMQTQPLKDLDGLGGDVSQSTG